MIKYFNTRLLDWGPLLIKIIFIMEIWLSTFQPFIDSLVPFIGHLRVIDFVSLQSFLCTLGPMFACLIVKV